MLKACQGIVVLFLFTVVLLSACNYSPEHEFYYQLNTSNDYKYRYTLDGSHPRNGELYKDSILIGLNPRLKEIAYIPTTPLEGASQLKHFIWDKPTIVEQKLVVLRYQGYDLNDSARTEIISKHFYIGSRTDERDTLPIISLAIDQKDLFDHTSGIYVAGKTFEDNSWNEWWPKGNFSNKGKTWEKAANVAMIDKDDAILFNENIGLRINGYGICAFPQKTLRLIFRKKYGKSKLKAKVFHEDSIQNYKRLILRNGGNDFVGSFIRDILAQTIAPNSQYTQNSRACKVYINGVFWGIHNIREKIDRHYIKSHFKLSKKQYSLYENCGSVISGDSKSFEELMDLATNKCIVDSAYYSTLAGKIDIDHFIDYILFQMYIANFDWPGANIKFFKAKDGRWKWLTFDLDLSFGYRYIAHYGKGADYNSIEIATDSNGKHWPNPYCSTILIRQLLKNPIIQQKCLKRASALADSKFSTSNVHRTIDSLENIYRFNMQEQIDRWGYPSSMHQWEKEIKYLKKFASKRPKYFMQHLNNYFNKNRN